VGRGTGIQRNNLLGKPPSPNRKNFIHLLRTESKPQVGCCWHGSTASGSPAAGPGPPSQPVTVTTMAAWPGPVPGLGHARALRGQLEARRLSKPEARPPALVTAARHSESRRRMNPLEAAGDAGQRRRRRTVRCGRRPAYKPEAPRTRRVHPVTSIRVRVLGASLELRVRLARLQVQPASLARRPPGGSPSQSPGPPRANANRGSGPCSGHAAAGGGPGPRPE
jgi:hypothetical protein